MNGFCGSETNKVCHILFGNRKNVGYTYIDWNCDKGYLSQKKLDDVKIAAEKFSPHAKGVSEVFFKRKESNLDESSNTILSTEQLLQKIEIPKYKVVLPDYWYKHNIARVYVKDDLKVKVKHAEEDSDHLQSILLELGYGRGKPHYFNFYYREWTSIIRGNNLHQEEDLDHLIER